MRHRTLSRGLTALSIGFSFIACEAEPQASAEQLRRAEQIYRTCVEEDLGLVLDELKLSPGGDIFVKFADGTSDVDTERALRICEPRIAFVLEPGSADLLGPPKNLGRPASDEELAQLARENVARGFEGALLVEQNGRTRLSVGAGGLRARMDGAPDADTAFDCGSIMKTVTAALVMVLEREGELSRTQTLGELFPEAPEVWRGVTVDQVLRHRAGFHEYHDTEGDFEAMDRSQAEDAIFAQEPLFEPGSESAYSNSGYTLLALLIERVTGHDFLALARARVFAPLGLERTGFYGDALWNDGNVAIGRGAERHRDNDPAHWPSPTWALIGNGGLVASARDLVRLARALDHDELFDSATGAEFRALEHAGSIDGLRWYGYAGGNDFGFGVVLLHVPDGDGYVVVASHVLSGVSSDALGVALLQSLYGAVAELPAPD